MDDRASPARLTLEDTDEHDEPTRSSDDRHAGRRRPRSRSSWSRKGVDPASRRPARQRAARRLQRLQVRPAHRGSRRPKTTSSSTRASYRVFVDPFSAQYISGVIDRLRRRRCRAPASPSRTRTPRAAAAAAARSPPDTRRHMTSRRSLAPAGTSAPSTRPAIVRRFAGLRVVGAHGDRSASASAPSSSTSTRTSRDSSRRASRR